MDYTVKCLYWIQLCVAQCDDVTSCIRARVNELMSVIDLGRNYNTNRTTVFFLRVKPFQPNFPRVHRTIVLYLIHGIDTFSAKHYNEYIIIAGDFNSLDCTALESQCGLVQLVSDPTHCNNNLDKVLFTNCSDLYSATVGKSLIKTKHHSVLVSAASSTHTPLPRRV